MFARKYILARERTLELEERVRSGFAGVRFGLKKLRKGRKSRLTLAQFHQSFRERAYSWKFNDAFIRVCGYHRSIGIYVRAYTHCRMRHIMCVPRMEMCRARSPAIFLARSLAFQT